jgi:hypothetical protein
MSQMKNSTKQDLLWLNLYGTFYVGGMQPYDIEHILDSPEMGWENMHGLFGSVAWGDQAGFAQASQIVSNTIKGLSLTTSVLSTVVASTAATGVGAVVGAGLIVAGAVINAVIKAVADRACDDSKSLPNRETYFLNKRNHFRGIVGINAPKLTDRIGGSCKYRDWGGSNSSTQGREGSLISYTNDGGWVHRYPRGSVIGVMGRTYGGSTSGCHRYYYDDSHSPRLGRMPQVVGNNPADEAKLSPEFLQRQKAVSLYLRWLQDDFGAYGLLSCMERALINEAGNPYPYKICTSGPGCEERASVRELQSKYGSFLEFKGKLPYRRLMASRWYTTIRAMFDASVKMSQAIGVGRASQIFRIAGAEKAADALLGKTTNGATAEEIAAWPEWPMAKEMSWKQLKAVHSRLSEEMIRVVAIQARVGRVAPLMIINNHSRLIWTGTPDRGRVWRPSTPVIVVGVGALAAAGFLWWRSRG